MEKTENEPSNEELTSVLKEAGIYEENMSKKDMQRIYQVINNSRTTAFEEMDSPIKSSSSEAEETQSSPEDQRSISFMQKPKEKKFINKTWTTDKNKDTNSTFEIFYPDKSETDSPEANEPNDEPRDATKYLFGFEEMSANAEKNPNIPVFKKLTCQLKKVNIQNTKLFLNADKRKRAKMLYAYHSEVERAIRKIAASSFAFAPLPKPITAQLSLNREEGLVDEPYVCRSGRQTKRKVYSYEEDSLDEFVQGSQKKSKNSIEDEWLSKYSSVQNKKTSKESRVPVKKTPNKILNDNRAMDEEDCGLEKLPEKNVATTTKTPSTSKDGALSTFSFLQRAKKLDNAEIMRTSKLFSDTPKRARRAEEMFDNLLKADRVKKRDEEVLDSFEKTLEVPDEEEFDDSIDIDGCFADGEASKRLPIGRRSQAQDENGESESEVINVDKTEERRRVIPQLPKRSGRKKTNVESKDGNEMKLDFLKNEAEPTKRKPCPLSKQKAVYSGNRKKKDGLKPLDIEIYPKQKFPVVYKANSSDDDVEIQETNLEMQPSTSGTETKLISESIPCPLCLKSFPKDKIEEHASNCCDEPEEKSGTFDRITCEICDKVLLYDTGYEAHVTECKKKHSNR